MGWSSRCTKDSHRSLEHAAYHWAYWVINNHLLSFVNKWKDMSNIGFYHGHGDFCSKPCVVIQESVLGKKKVFEIAKQQQLVDIISNPTMLLKSTWCLATTNLWCNPAPTGWVCWWAVAAHPEPATAPGPRHVIRWVDLGLRSRRELRNRPMKRSDIAIVLRPCCGHASIIGWSAGCNWFQRYGTGTILCWEKTFSFTNTFGR